MQKHVEMFYANKGYRLAIFFFNTNFSVFKIEVCGTLFKRCLDENEALHTPISYMKMNLFKIVFHITRNKVQRFTALSFGFERARFQGSVFSQVQGPIPVFR